MQCSRKTVVRTNIFENNLTNRVEKNQNLFKTIYYLSITIVYKIKRRKNC